MGKPDVLIQVLVPFYNGEIYLRETLVSLRDQNHRNIDCLLIDDASEDSSASIAQEFVQSDSRFRLIKNSTNMGESFSVNLGWQMRNSQLVTVVNHDDPQTLDWLENVLSFFELNPGYLFYYPHRRVIDELGVEKRLDVLEPWSRFKTQRELITIPSVGTLIDASKFPKDFQPRINEVRIPSDFTQFYKMSMYGKGKLVSTIFANWRDHSNNLSSAAIDAYIIDFLAGIEITLLSYKSKIVLIERASVAGQIFLIYRKSFGVYNGIVKAKTVINSRGWNSSGLGFVLFFLLLKWSFRKLKRKIFGLFR